MLTSIFYIAIFFNLFVRIQKVASLHLNQWSFSNHASSIAGKDYRNLKFAVTGGGAFSLALIKVLSYKDIPCNLLLRNQTIADHINLHKRHPKYLSDFPLPANLWATTDPTSAFDNVDYIIHAVPVQQSRKFLESVKKDIPASIPIMSVSKGVEQGNLCLMSEIFDQTIGSKNKLAFLSGPSFAQEIMKGEATAVVIASQYKSLAEDLSDIFSSIEFRCHTSTDAIGIELGGAIKNVIALAAGMCEGLDLGMNAMSSLVTRGCKEMSR